uniref:Uncharacterized protein n=1 Tax=Ananas comosus var. bracteatus TaxID=296719 RepID=A0A6V7PHK5_ANACO|nr:unnamed protein product [Ananas comosus var. bracteatus]
MKETMSLPRRRFEVGESSCFSSGKGRQEALTSCRRVTARRRVGKEKKISKRIVWADEVFQVREDRPPTIQWNREDDNMADAPGELEDVDPPPQSHRALSLTHRASRKTSATRGSSTARQTRSAATPRAPCGRRCWVPTGRRGPKSDAIEALGSRTAESGLISVSGQSTPRSPSLPVPPYWWTSPAPVYGPSFGIRLEAYCCWSPRGGFRPPGSPLGLGAQNSFSGLLLPTLSSMSPNFSGSLQGWTSSAAVVFIDPPSPDSLLPVANPGRPASPLFLLHGSGADLVAAAPTSRSTPPWPRTTRSSSTHHLRTHCLPQPSPPELTWWPPPLPHARPRLGRTQRGPHATRVQGFCHSDRRGPARLETHDSLAPLRSSTRLLNANPDSTICRAMSRKAMLLEGASSGPKTKDRKLTRKRERSKNLMCGVVLSDTEAAELRRFI